MAAFVHGPYLNSEPDPKDSEHQQVEDTQLIFFFFFLLPSHSLGTVRPVLSRAERGKKLPRKIGGKKEKENV